MEQLVINCSRCGQSYDLTGYEANTYFQCECGEGLYHPAHPAHPSKRGRVGLPPLDGGLPPLEGGLPPLTGGLPPLTGGMPFPPAPAGLAPFPPLSGGLGSQPGPGMPLANELHVSVGGTVSPDGDAPQELQVSVGGSISVGELTPQEPQATAAQPGFSMEEFMQMQQEDANKGATRDESPYTGPMRSESQGSGVQDASGGFGGYGSGEAQAPDYHSGSYANDARELGAEPSPKAAHELAKELSMSRPDPARNGEPFEPMRGGELPTGSISDSRAHAETASARDALSSEHVSGERFEGVDDGDMDAGIAIDDVDIVDVDEHEQEQEPREDAAHAVGSSPSECVGDAHRTTAADEPGDEFIPDDLPLESMGEEEVSALSTPAKDAPATPPARPAKTELSIEAIPAAHAEQYEAPQPSPKSVDFSIEDLDAAVDNAEQLDLSLALKQREAELDQLRKDFRQLETDYKVLQSEMRESLALVQQQWSQVQAERGEAQEEVATLVEETLGLQESLEQQIQQIEQEQSLLFEELLVAAKKEWDVQQNEHLAALHARLEALEQRLGDEAPLESGELPLDEDEEA